MLGIRPENFELGEGSDGIGIDVAVVEELGADAFLYGTVTGLIAEEELINAQQITARILGRTPPHAGRRSGSRSTRSTCTCSPRRRATASPRTVRRLPRRRRHRPGTQRCGWVPMAVPRFRAGPGKISGCRASFGSTPDSQLITLPWQTPLEEWPEEHLVALPRGISRHVVRFVRVGKEVYAVKEVLEHLALHEYRCSAT